MDRKERPAEESKEICQHRGKRFAVVDEQAPIRFLSWEEFASLKELNPKLIEMKAGDIVYLTEPPLIKA